MQIYTETLKFKFLYLYKIYKAKKMFKLTFLKCEYNLRERSIHSNDNQIWYFKILCVLFNAFIVTPIVIIYWACAWDIM